ncbi:hypothetical protein [Micromonospora chokoriensis]|uniref:hypothetical protein n=1 Tax=Micromonospora chokoriensis TaxID=356851 RepID=UPI0012F74481|nr:hypothetical protein [Micromonospora chokoriensis]
MAGTVAYQIDGCVVPATGFELTATDVEEIAPAIRAILRDDSGLSEAFEALQDLPRTEFAVTMLQRVLEPPSKFEEWRVGEALAEHHLSISRDCTFPWADSRSARNPNSISGGVDLIGFHSGDRVRFVFAEVKTSHHQSWPPSVVTSRSEGLRGQLSGLNDSDDRSRWAIKYLTMNSINKPWFSIHRQAMQTYLADVKDVMLFGVLVHVATANMKDLEALTNRLSELPATKTAIELIGLYIEADVLASLVEGPIAVETAA